jgi:hypothetical protein
MSSRQINGVRNQVDPITRGGVPQGDKFEPGEEFRDAAFQYVRPTHRPRMNDGKRCG